MTTQHDPIKDRFDAHCDAINESVNARLDKIRTNSTRTRTLRPWLVTVMVACSAAIFMTTQSYAIEPMPYVDEAEFELMLSDELTFIALRDNLVEITPNEIEGGAIREDGETHEKTNE